jgi:hypothetical protein
MEFSIVWAFTKFLSSLYISLNPFSNIHQLHLQYKPPFSFVFCPATAKRPYKVYCIKQSVSTDVSLLHNYIRFSALNDLFGIYKPYHHVVVQLQ